MRENRASKRFTAIVFTLTALMTAFIWVHSLMPADLSSQESAGLTELLYGFFRQFGMEKTAVHQLIRKLAHFSEYAAFGCLLLSCAYSRDRFKPWRYAVPVLFAGLMTAVIDETVQLFSEGRAGLIADVWIDFGGVLCGALITLGLTALHVRRKRKNHQ